MKKKWIEIIDKLDFAFQPIIHSHTGRIYAVEALLRNVGKATGYHNIQDVFDSAFDEGILYQIDLELRRKPSKI